LRGVLVRTFDEPKLEGGTTSHDLKDRIPDTTQLEIFTLPIDAARRKARVDQFPQSGFFPIMENWRQRPDGQIEFAIRHPPMGD
jgi:hypothetical protein